MSGISMDELQSALFPSTLKDELKRLKILNGQVTTWEDLIENFIKKFFPSVENAKRRQNLMLLKPHHDIFDIPKCVLMEGFYFCLRKDT